MKNRKFMIIMVKVLTIKCVNDFKVINLKNKMKKVFDLHTPSWYNIV